MHACIYQVNQSLVETLSIVRRVSQGFLGYKGTGHILQWGQGNKTKKSLGSNGICKPREEGNKVGTRELQRKNSDTPGKTCNRLLWLKPSKVRPTVARKKTIYNNCCIYIYS